MKTGFKGFDFNDDRDGIWFEGKSHMTVAYTKAEKNINTDRRVLVIPKKP